MGFNNFQIIFFNISQTGLFHNMEDFDSVLHV